MIGSVMGAGWRLARRFEVLEPLVYASLKLCPFGKVVLSTGGHELRFG